jgi:N-acetylglucosaminyldiphosphoundecaprenol N-acetyl-beta-D-mannosaminyltransferase
MALKHASVLGTRLACTSYAGAVAEIQMLGNQARPSAVCAANTHIVSLARHDPTFGSVMGAFDLILPDGMPLVWALNRKGAGLADRVYGPYFMREAIRSLGAPWRHFFFGGKTDTLERLQNALLALNPNLQIVGTLSPPFRAWTEEDEAEFARAIADAKADFVWVALGGERQERWIQANLHRHSRGVFLAVGDAFELLAGNRPFAPAWMQRCGLTWLYRLLQEPGRLWPRYFRYNSLFLRYSLLDALARRRAALPPACARHGLEIRAGVHHVGPVRFHDVSKHELIEAVLLSSRPPRIFTALNAFSLSLALDDPRLLGVLNRSFICFCDGFGIHVLHRLFEHCGLRHRTTPTDWLEDLIAAAHARGQKIFMLGDRQRVVQTFCARMEQRHPGVVAGFHNGFFKENSPEETAIVRQINQSGADVLVLCMGMPRQEFWAERHRNHLACSSILMAGASMAFLTGFRRRGPRWATDRGLEWFFRLAYEPLTMAPRYLFGLPRLLLQMLRWKLGNRDRGRETGN